MIDTVAPAISSEFSTAIYAAVAGFVVGAVIKLVNRFADKDKDQLETHVILRRELREELGIVKQDLEKLQEELDEWKQKYYNQVEFTNELKLSIIKLSGELDKYKTLYVKLMDSHMPEELI
jgi:hypothetical protein